MKILHAPHNIANEAFIMSQALRDLGHQSDLMVYSPNVYYPNFDKHITMEGLSCSRHHQKYLKILLSLIARYNIFHFHFGDTLLPHNGDIPFIKAFGKKIVMQYWGSDVRRLSIASKLNKYAVVKVEDEREIIRKLKNHSRFVDAAIVSDHEIYEYVRDFFKRIEVIRPMLDLDSFTMKLPTSDIPKPLIVHAPSHRKMKGTEYILKAIKYLQLIELYKSL